MTFEVQVQQAQLVPLQVQQMNFKKCLFPLKSNKSEHEVTKIFSIDITKKCWLTCLSHTRR